MDYLLFDLLVGQADANGYPVTVIESPAGEGGGVLLLDPQDGELQDALALIENRYVDADSLAQIGGFLFAELFSGPVGALYRSSLALARDRGSRLRLRLRLEAPEVAALPWEYLHDPDEDQFPALSPETALLRFLPLRLPARPTPVTPPLRLLVVISHPAGVVPLDVAQETAILQEALDEPIRQKRGELHILEEATVAAINQAMRTVQPHIFHFIGHGDFDPALGEGRIALVDEASGHSHFLSATQLGRLFDDHRSLRLAVLNACEGARASEQNLFSSAAAVLARRGVPAVVSMQYPISDQAAIEFARAFYDGLARGLAVDEAVQASRLAISMAPAVSAEWATPVLHMRAPDGVLLRVDLAGAIFRQPNAAPQPAAPTPPSSQPAASGEDRRGLEILLRKVRQYWIEGVLEKSLFQAILIDLGMARMSGAVDSPFGDTPWGGLMERPDGESQPLPPEQSLASLYDDEGGSLLVLGEPGSGKTTSLLELAQGLLARAEADPRRPVPVVFNLSSWVEPHTELDTWLADELSGRYQIPRKIGRVWLAESRVVPLLDGLDELAPPRRAACVEAVNRFSQGAGLVGAVVCCRLAEYIDLPVRLSLNAAVRLLPLADEQVQGYLSGLGERLAGLRTLLQRDSALRLEARSPLMLSLMVRAYQDLPAAQLLQESAATAAARRKQLMSAYVDRMFRLAGLGRNG